MRALFGACLDEMLHSFAAVKVGRRSHRLFLVNGAACALERYGRFGLVMEAFMLGVLQKFCIVIVSFVYYYFIQKLASIFNSCHRFRR